MITIFKAILVVFKNSEMTFCIEEQATMREDCSRVRCPDTWALILMSRGEAGHVNQSGCKSSFYLYYIGRRKGEITQKKGDHFLERGGAGGRC